jgi:hypothetical protein
MRTVDPARSPRSPLVGLLIAASAVCLLIGAGAEAQPPDYLLLRRCTATGDGIRVPRGAQWQPGIAIVAIQLPGGAGGWTPRHTFEFDTFAFQRGENGIREYGFGDDVCMGRAADLPGTLTYSTVTTGPDAVSGSFSLAESPGAIYGQNLDITATINQAFDLTGSSVTLTYYHHHGFTYSNFVDEGTVEVSTNGGTDWTRVKLHNHTLGDFAQYKRTDLDLDAFLGQSILIRFRFTSDSVREDDGWNIEDIRLTMDDTTIFFDDFESGLGNWTTTGTWGLDSLRGFSLLGTVDQDGVYSTTPVTLPTSVGAGIGYGGLEARYVDGPTTLTAYARIYHTAPQFVVPPDLGFDDLCQPTTVVSEEPSPLRQVVLDQNSPNPFNPTTDIHFALDPATPVALRIYDQAGRLKRTLIDWTMLPAGRHGLTWDGRDDSGRAARSGVYFYALRVSGSTEEHMRKMVLVR